MKKIIGSARDKFSKLQQEKSANTTTSLSALVQISPKFAHADNAVEGVNRKET